MKDSDYYPPGSYNDPRAPWNEEETPEKEIDVAVSITLSKSTTLTVNDYTMDEWKDSEVDEDGRVITTGGVDYDFSDCDLDKAYEEQEYTIPQMLEKLKEYLEKDLEKPENKNNYQLKLMLTCCKDWTVDEQEVVLDK